MSSEVSETLKNLASEYQCATTQKERDRIWQEIIRVSYRQEADREREWRRTRQGEFESSMPSLDAQVEKFDDPGKIAAFSDGGAGAERIFAKCSEHDRARQVADALSRLPPKAQDFASAVRHGATWRELGLTRQGFNFKIRGLERKLSLRSS